MDKFNKNHQFIKTYRSRHIHSLGIAALSFLGFVASPSAVAQTYTLTTLVSFNGTNGAEPQAGLTLSDNTLYGAAIGEGIYGSTVFSVPTTGGASTILASFNGSNVSYPEGSLTLSGGILYGIAGDGGDSNDGAVFSVPVTGGTPTVLASFNGANGGGKSPNPGLVLSGNTLYGTTFTGGDEYGDGTVFSVPITGGSPTTLATFGAISGYFPYVGMTLSGSTLYGTTEFGGDGNAGTVFSLPTDGGTPTVLASFNIFASLVGTYEAYPEPRDLTLSGNILYGTTYRGGTDNEGAVFSVPITGGTPTILASFKGANGSNPQGGLVISGNTIYGTTATGGANGNGTVFSVPITGGTPNVLVNFNGSNGNYPNAGLIMSGGTLYGTTLHGGENDIGTVFALTLDQSPVPEASSVVSLGLMLSLGLGSMVITTKRARTQRKIQR